MWDGKEQKKLAQKFHCICTSFGVFFCQFLIFFRWGVPAVMDGWYYHTTVVAFGPSAFPDVGLAWWLGCGSG